MPLSLRKPHFLSSLITWNFLIKLMMELENSCSFCGSEDDKIDIGTAFHLTNYSLSTLIIAMKRSCAFYICKNTQNHNKTSNFACGKFKYLKNPGCRIANPMHFLPS